MDMNRIILIFLILFSILKNSFSQTDSLIIYKYNSLKEWEGDLMNKTSFIDNHFKGGYENFHKILLTNLKNNAYLYKICSTGILLFNLVFEKNTVTINFANKYLYEQKENLTSEIKELDTFWIKLPIERYVFNFSIGYIYHLDNEILKGDDGTSFENHIYFEKVAGESTTCNCLFKNILQIEEQLTNATVLRDYDIAIVLLKELMRRQPFNKEYYFSYKKVLLLQFNNS